MGLFNFNRLSRAEGEIINKANQVISGRNKERHPNSHIGGRVTTEEFEDDYTKKMRAEKILASQEEDNKNDYFIDADGRKTPIEQLNGQTEKLLREARDSLTREFAGNRDSAQEETNNQTPEMAKNDLRQEKFKDWNPGLKSLAAFHSKTSAHYDTETGKIKKKNLGLYKHNPKLNPGSPENRKERRRRSRKLSEENKWQPGENEPDWPDDISG